MAMVIHKINPIKPIRPKLTRVVAYCRVSSDKEAMLHSISAQVSYYSQYIQATPGWLYTGVYADTGITGTKDNRQEFQRMLVDCRAGKIDMVITKSISRFARNTVTLLQTVRELKELGVDVFFEEQNIHSISGDGELMLTILASYAQEESRSVSENCKWRIRNRFAVGDAPAVSVYGYQIVDNQYVIDEKEALVIRLIFEKHAQGMGAWSIANMLDQLGVKAPYTNRWNGSTIRYMLRNERYIGDLLLQKSFVESHITKRQVINRGELEKYYVEQACPAIISKELFIRSQEVSEAQTYGNEPGEGTEGNFFKGKIICPHCAKAYKRKKAHGKYAWNCATFLRKGKNYCHGKQIPEDTLWDLVFELVGEEAVDIIDRILVPAPNRLDFVLKSGAHIEKEWEDHSRKDSWNPEMRRQAAENGRKRCRI